MTISWQELVTEVGEWSQRNFGDGLPIGSGALLGVVEELGEFAVAQNHSDRADALADATIYLADYCYRNRISLLMGTPFYTLSEAIGRLCHYHLKGFQGIRHSPEEIKSLKESAACNLLATLRDEALICAVPFEESVMETWQTVKQRDWQTNKKDGKPTPEFKYPVLSSAEAEKQRGANG